MSVPEIRVGHVKTFGTEGPAYIVTGVPRQTDQGDWLVPIIVAVSGEELEYPYSHFVGDPDERPMHPSHLTQVQRDELDRRLNDVHQPPHDGVLCDEPNERIAARA